MSEAAVALFVVFDPPRIEQILKPAYRQALFRAVVQESSLRARSDSVSPVEYAPAQVCRSSHHARNCRLANSGRLSYLIVCGCPRPTAICSSTHVTLRLAELVSTSKAKHFRVYASSTLSTRIVRPQASASCTKSGAHCWFAAVQLRSGCPTRYNACGSSAESSALAKNPMKSLVVHPSCASSWQDMQPPIPEARKHGSRAPLPPVPSATVHRWAGFDRGMSLPPSSSRLPPAAR
jgi:hypothetical protein